jgi:hypothetical protein
MEMIFNLFGQYGLAGLVIAAQFYFMMLFLKKLDSINETHNARHDRRNDLHAAERREWLEVTREIAATLITLAAQFEARLK